MKKYIVILAFTVLGFYVGYILFGEAHGIKLSVSEVFFGVNTKFGVVNDLANDFLSSARYKVLVSTLVGLIAGLGFYMLSTKRSRR